MDVAGRLDGESAWDPRAAGNPLQHSESPRQPSTQGEDRKQARGAAVDRRVSGQEVVGAQAVAGDRGVPPMRMRKRAPQIGPAGLP